METASAGDRGLKPIAVLAVAAGALLAIAAAVAWLSDSPAAPDRLEQMGCRELAAEILEGSEAKRRAALEMFERKKCL